MCGICGFAGIGTLDDLHRMNEALFHRGPDAEGFWSDSGKGIYIGHRRLSILDISGGAQPMWTSDNSLCITFNGEIYNYRELREQLEKEGHIFRTDHSDTEVLLHGYRKWGKHLPSKLNGMWAFAIYDKSEHTIFLSRDRFGKKPLFYTLLSDTFIFSSELSSLRKHPLVNGSISIPALKKYFAYGYVPAPNTIYNGIYKLPAGHNLFFKLSDKRLSIEKYWELILEPFETTPPNAEKEWCDQLRYLIDKAVNRRLMSDVPLGIFLSGGIDSSSIVRFASNHLSHDNLKTFSIGFLEPSFDESSYSSFAATAFNTIHHQKSLSMEDAKLLLEDIADKLDEPIGDSSILPTYLLCKETRKYVTVALGGDGADELFAGYDPFRALKIADFYSKIFHGPVHRAIFMAIQRLPVSHVNMSFDFKLKRTLRGISYPRKIWNPIWLGPLDPSGIQELFSEKIDIEDLYSEAIITWDECKLADPVDKTLQFYTRLYLQNDILVKIDRASMMNSLEVRAPFLDIELVDFVRKIPSCYKFRNGCTKYILKKALEPVLPSQILYRKKKGFGVPVGRWFKDGYLSIDNRNSNSHLNSSFINDQIKDHLENRSDNRNFLWNLWLLNKFIKDQ